MKIEAGPYEQTYKISEMDINEPDEIPAMLDDLFLERVAKRFRDMDLDWQQTGERNGVL